MTKLSIVPTYPGYGTPINTIRAHVRASQWGWSDECVATLPPFVYSGSYSMIPVVQYSLLN